MGHTVLLFNMVVMVNGMHTVTPGQNKAWEFGMNGSGMYGTKTPWARGTYCVQIFKDGPTLDAQWPVFNKTHKGMSFESRAPFKTCDALPAKYGAATQIDNPVLADGSVVGAGSWFKM